MNCGNCGHPLHGYDLKTPMDDPDLKPGSRKCIASLPGGAGYCGCLESKTVKVYDKHDMTKVKEQLDALIS